MLIDLCALAAPTKTEGDYLFEAIALVRQSNGLMWFKTETTRNGTIYRTFRRNLGYQGQRSSARELVAYLRKQLPAAVI